MPLGANTVEAALERWVKARLLTPELATVLRDEAREEDHRSSRSVAQYALAATGALVLLVAAGVFGDWLWPRIDVGGRTAVLLLTGFAVYMLGLELRRRQHWRAASYGLQIAGMLALLGTYGYSREAWPDATVGGKVIGLLALLTPLLAAPASLFKRDPVMPAAHLALSLGFLAVFLIRGFGLEPNTVVWILDGALGVMSLLLVRAVLEACRDEDPEAADWALHTFVIALYAGLVLVMMTGLGPMNMSERVVYPIGVWLGILVSLALWGTHGAPLVLRRHWYEMQLAVGLLLAIPLLFTMTIEVWDASEEVTAALVGGVGILGLRYAIVFGARATLAASCLALLSAAWFYGTSKGGALGVVLSLVASAALLLWVSTRVGWRGERGEAASPDSVDGRAGSP